MKGNNKMNNNNISVFDSISGYSMGFNAEGDMILVKDGKEYKLADNEVILNAHKGQLKNK